MTAEGSPTLGTILFNRGAHVIQRAGEKSPTIFEGKSCVECGHIRVCTIHRFLSRFLEESFPNDEKGKSIKPLESKDLAQLCSLYVSGSAVNALVGS